MGHDRPSEQQAIRASGVAIQPAHTPAWLAASASVNRSAERRLLRISTYLRMLERGHSVNRGYGARPCQAEAQRPFRLERPEEREQRGALGIAEALETSAGQERLAAVSAHGLIHGGG